MQCPVDGAKLTMTDRQGVEIDYCPDCRGVWLDRGELDKLIEREPARGVRYDRDEDDDRRGSRERESRFYDRDREHSGGYPKKKKNWLGEIFDV